MHYNGGVKLQLVFDIAILAAQLYSSAINDWLNDFHFINYDYPDSLFLWLIFLYDLIIIKVWSPWRI